MIEVNCKDTFDRLARIEEQTYNPLMTLSSVLLIGGVIHGEGHLDPEDQASMYIFATELMKIAVRLRKPHIISSNPDYNPLNADGLKDDFIRDMTPADLIVSCFVNKGFEAHDEHFQYYESPLLEQGKTWCDAFRQANPKFIGINTNSKDCVGKEDIPKNYRFVARVYESTMNDRLLYGREDVLAELGPVA